MSELDANNQSGSSEGVDCDRVYEEFAHLQEDNSCTFSPYVGQTFRCDEEAYNFYYSFAKKNGFSIRRGRSLGSMKHELGFYRRQFLCHRAGKPQQKKIAEVEHQRDRKSSLCNCQGKMTVSKEVFDGVSRWKIVEFNNLHNHELLKYNEVRFLPAYRNIESLDQNRILLLSKAGCCMRLIMRVLELEKNLEPGGLPFTEKDVRNLIQAHSSKRRDNDAHELLKICKTLKDQDAAFCYEFTLDEDQKLEHIMWSFGDSVRAYELFGDVVVFDTTYRINQYDMPLGVWVGVNNHGNSIFFGCVLLRDERSISFSWALKTFVHFMGGKQPRTILSDQDLALTDAISNELPNTKHAFCIWHIVSKLSTWFSFVLGTRYTDFTTEFYRLYHLENVEEFENQWHQMASDFGLASDNHIDLLFTHRQSWALAYLRNFFFAGMTTTGRSESINAFLKRFLNARTSLKEFIEQVGVAVSVRHQRGEEATMRQRYLNPTIKTFMPIEEHASTVLTPYAFKLLQNEMVLSTQYAAIEIENGKYLVRHLSKTEGGRVVDWVPTSEEINCSCKEFEFSGILCRHVIRIFSIKNYFCLPSKYFLERWSREGLHNSNSSQHQSNEDSFSRTFESYITEFHSEAYKSKERIKFASEELVKLITHVKSILVDEDPLQKVQNPFNEESDGFEVILIKNPNRSKTKGRPREKRPFGGLESAKKPRYCHVPNCGGIGHDSRNCPNKNVNVQISNLETPNKNLRGWRKRNQTS